MTPRSPTSEPSGWIRRGPGGLDRFEACFAGTPFTSHRHDTYAFCITVSGVQSFAYRGEVRHSLVAGVVVLHPDELHDGRAGTEAPFRYRCVYVPPARLQCALGGAPLPHLEAGTSTDPRLLSAVKALLLNLDRPLEPLECDDGLFTLATTLAEVCGTRPASRRVVSYAAVDRARSFLDAHAGDTTISMDDLEHVADHDRWQLSRDFRTALGTSPYRYGLLRRLERARALLEKGTSGAQAAAECGFSDQSHLIRQFRHAYGMTPSRWCSVLGIRPRLHKCTMIQ